MNDTPNSFGQLDAQSAEAHLAQVASHEPHVNDCGDNLCPRCACDPCKCNWSPDDNDDTYTREQYEADCRAAQGDEPDAHLDASYEARTECEDAPYDGGGWPGDGSGTDDLADLNADEADDYRNE